MNKITIEDLSLLKITKVKPWAICFDYDSSHYLLYGNTDNPETQQDLFERILNKHGKYTLKYICSKIGEKSDVWDDYIKCQNGTTIVYSQVDKEYFANKLIMRGFAKGSIKAIA